MKALCRSDQRASAAIGGQTFLGCPIVEGSSKAELFAFLRILPDRALFDGVIYEIQLTAASDAKAGDEAIFEHITEGFRSEKALLYETYPSRAFSMLGGYDAT